MLRKLSLTIGRVLSYLPTRLPVGMTHYEKWLASIIELTADITADAQSIAWVVSNEIMRLPPGKDRAPKAYFVKSLRKFAANQIAGAKVMEIKEQQEAAQKAAQAKTVEATAASAADGTNVQTT